MSEFHRGYIYHKPPERDDEPPPPMPYPGQEDRAMSKSVLEGPEGDVCERIRKFHAHLDVCSQCRNHSFSLCATGAQLLREAAVGGPDQSQQKEAVNDKP